MPLQPPLSPGAQEILSAFSLDSGGALSPAATISPNSKKKKPAARRISERPPPLEGDNNNTKISRHSLRGVGVVKDDTPIPNSDIALRVLRKFALKVEKNIPETHGGTQALSLWTRYVSGAPSDTNTKFDAYLEFVTVLGSGSGEDETSDNAATATASSTPDDAEIDAVLGASGDTMAKARQAMATFCHLLSVWSHASAHVVEKSERNSKENQVFCGMIATGYDTATALCTHGCLDGVMVGIGPDKSEYHKMVDVLAESVFSSDWSHSATELSVMKFLFSTGC
ncbi:MAG: hypothetical protein SGARI_007062, partial [Bacillariaceae sp.]